MWERIKKIRESSYTLVIGVKARPLDPFQFYFVLQKKKVHRILHENYFLKCVSLVRCCNLNWFKWSYTAVKNGNWDLFWLGVDDLSSGLTDHNSHRSNWQGGYFTLVVLPSNNLLIFFYSIWFFLALFNMVNICNSLLHMNRILSCSIKSCHCFFKST